MSAKRHSAICLFAMLSAIPDVARQLLFRLVFPNAKQILEAKMTPAREPVLSMSPNVAPLFLLSLFAMLTDAQNKLIFLSLASVFLTIHIHLLPAMRRIGAMDQRGAGEQDLILREGFRQDSAMRPHMMVQAQARPALTEEFINNAVLQADAIRQLPVQAESVLMGK